MPSPQKEYMGAMSRSGSMGDSKVGTAISRCEKRVPLAMWNTEEATGKAGKPLCKSMQALLNFWCKTPALIDPEQPFPSTSERLRMSDALGIKYTMYNVVYTAFAAARKAERNRLALPKLPRGRPMGAKAHGARRTLTVFDA